MTEIYHHTQHSALPLVLLLPFALALVFAFMTGLGTVPRVLLIGLSILAAATAFFFSSLTVEVTEENARWHFALPIPSFQIVRAEVNGVRVVRTRLSNGFGIRMGPHSRLYNISGFDAVEIHLKSGTVRWIYIGSDDATGLATAL